ncbi:hypothetical protein [Actinospica sp.]|nr:hypothetical protein [Actinospica sp.]HWG23393.1 hypothetical protein [Actinospica sp.]
MDQQEGEHGLLLPGAEVEILAAATDPQRAEQREAQPAFVDPARRTRRYQ